MRVIIFGCGRTGAALAKRLARLKHEVVVIERDPQMLGRLGQDHGCTIIVGNGLDDDILERAGIRSADCFIASTRGDNSNLMAAQIARARYSVPRICAKVNDPERAREYQKLGVFCITPNLLTAGMMKSWIVEEPFASIETYNVLEGGEL